MTSSYAVIASDGDVERCEGLHGTIAEALARARTIAVEGIARECWVVTLIPATQAFTRENSTADIRLVRNAIG